MFSGTGPVPDLVPGFEVPIRSHIFYFCWSRKFGELKIQFFEYSSFDFEFPVPQIEVRTVPGPGPQKKSRGPGQPWLQATMIGLFLGSVLGGNLTDYFGRINTMKLCTVMISIFLLLPAMIIRRLPVEMFILKYSIIFVSRVMVASRLRANELDYRHDLHD